MDTIENLNLNSEIDQNLIFSLLKSKNSLTNLGIISKIRQFSQTNDFFTYYTNINTKSFDLFLNKSLKKSLFYIKKISALKDLFKFRIESDKYISITSSVVLLFYILLKYQRIINIISSKIQKIISNTNSNLTDYDSLKEKINLISKNLNLNYSSNYSRNSTKHNTYLSNINFLDDVPTPKFFEFESEEKNNNQKDLYLSFGIDNDIIENNNSKRKDSFTSFSNISFSNIKEENPKIKKKIENYQNRSVKHNRTCSVDKMCVPYVNLLCLSNEMYKKKMINFNEKLMLKELIIGNDQRLISLYKCSTNRENEFYTIKKYLTETKKN